MREVRDPHFKRQTWEVARDPWGLKKKDKGRGRTFQVGVFSLTQEERLS